MVQQWPLVGRDDVLAHVRSLLRRPALTGLVLVGPAGVGKTRLAAECQALGEEVRMVAAKVVASRAAAAIPLGALAPLLPPEVAAAGPGMVPRAQEALAGLGGDRRLLLLVDDAHNLDEASALVVRHLAASASTFVVATVRTGEPAPDPVTALWAEEHVERRSVGPLDEAAVAELLAATLGGPVDAAARRALWTACEGNVLLLRELVLAGLEARTLVDDGGLWRVHGPLSTSPRLADLVASRLTGLDADERAALEYVAFGEPLGRELLAGATSPVALDALVAKGLVREEVDGRRAQIRLSHPLHGDVLRDATPVVRARAVQRRLASAMAATGARRRGDALREAVWRLESGADTTPEMLAAAATQARMARDTDGARRLARASFDERPGFDVGYLLADCLYDLGLAEETEEVLAAIEPLATSDADRGLVAALRSINLFWHLRRSDDALAAIDVVVGSMRTPEAGAEAQARAAVLEAVAGRPRDAMARAEPLLHAAAGRDFCQAALAAGLALPMLGRPRDGAEIAAEGAAAYAALGHQLAMFEPALFGAAEALALGEAGRGDEAAGVARESFDRALAGGDGPGLAFNALARGMVDLERGALVDSERWWREATGMFRMVQHVGLLRWALAGLLFAQALQADVTGGEATLAELDEIGEHPARMQEGNLLRAKGWLAVARADLVDARRWFEDAVALAAAEGVVTQELAALHDEARTGAGTPSSTRVASLAAAMATPLAAARVMHIEALVSGDAAALSEASQALEQSGAVLAAAEAAQSAADAQRRAARSRGVGPLQARADALAARCHGAATPGLRRAATVTLTRREAEVARLAATGLASRDIAEALALSVRTVDNHLARVYDKLGVRNRGDLAPALQQMVECRR